MEFLANAIAFFQANYGNICAAIVALVGFASVVVAITPTKTDDEILAKVVAFLNTFSILTPKGKVEVSKAVAEAGQELVDEIKADARG